MTLRLIRVAGFVAWFISTVGGGRGEFIYILAIAHLLGAQAVAPVVTFGNLLGVPSRIYLFRTPYRLADRALVFVGRGTRRDLADHRRRVTAVSAARPRPS
ncbi:MAG TPA: hypothetical protein VF342_14005 [Alphaproteobacteria bacterium]